jgi:hypothetical protein
MSLHAASPAPIASFSTMASSAVPSGLNITIVVVDPAHLPAILAVFAASQSGHPVLPQPQTQPQPPDTEFLLSPRAFAHRYHMRLADAYAIAKVPEIRVVRPRPGSRRVKIDVHSYERWRQKHPSGRVDRPDAPCS